MRYVALCAAAIAALAAVTVGVAVPAWAKRAALACDARDPVALERYSLALRFRPWDTDLLRGRCVAQSVQGHEAAAFADSDRWVRAAPSDPQARLRRAELRDREHPATWETDESIVRDLEIHLRVPHTPEERCCERARGLHGWVMRHWGHEYAREGRMRESLGAFRRHEILNHAGRAAAAVALAWRARARDSVEDYREAMDLDLDALLRAALDVPYIVYGWGAWELDVEIWRNWLAVNRSAPEAQRVRNLLGELYWVRQEWLGGPPKESLVLLFRALRVDSEFERWADDRKWGLPVWNWWGKPASGV